MSIAVLVRADFAQHGGERRTLRIGKPIDEVIDRLAPQVRKRVLAVLALGDAVVLLRPPKT
ncbi:MAG: hypothetical protein R3F11_22255 [Verrucomicrobiales bacterium]